MLQITVHHQWWINQYWFSKNKGLNNTVRKGSGERVLCIIIIKRVITNKSFYNVLLGLLYCWQILIMTYAHQCIGNMTNVLLINTLFVLFWNQWQVGMLKCTVPGNVYHQQCGFPLWHNIGWYVSFTNDMMTDDLAQ